MKFLKRFAIFCVLAGALTYGCGSSGGGSGGDNAGGGNPTVYQCNDQQDNDGDTLTDYPNDPGCLSSTDNNEDNASPNPIIGAPTTLSFNVTTCGSNPANQTFQVTNTGTGTLNFSITDDANWLALTPTIGTAIATITASINVTGLSCGQGQTYTATITITGNAVNSPKYVTVNLVMPTILLPTISLNSTTLNFSPTSCGSNPSTQTFSITNTGQAGSALNWSGTDNQTWISLSSISGSLTQSSSQTITISIDTTGLTCGQSYSGIITISDSSATNSPQTVAVNLTIPSPLIPSIGKSSSSMTFSANVGASATPQTLSIWNAGTGTLSYSIADNATWLSESPTSGTSTGETDSITVNATCSGLTAGTYSGTITLSATGANNTPQSVSVTLNCASLPQIGLTKTSLSFTTLIGQAAPNDSFGVLNSGSGTLNYTITDNASWLTLSPTSGTSIGETDTITATASCASLAKGTYNGTITISATGAGNTPQAVGVSLTCNNRCDYFTDIASIMPGQTTVGQQLTTGDQKWPSPDDRYIDDWDLSTADGQTLDVKLTTTTFLPRVFVYDTNSCTVRKEAAGSGFNAEIPLMYVPPGASFVIVPTSEGPNVTGSYNLIVTKAPYDFTIGVGETTSGNNSSYGNTWSSYNCIGWNESGPDAIYAIESSSGFTATLSGMSVDLDIFILSAGNSNSCVAYGNNSATVSSGGTYLIVVDGFNGASGNYTLQITP